MNLEKPQLLSFWLQQENQQLFDLTPIADALNFKLTAAFSLPTAPPKTPRYFALVITGLTPNAQAYQLSIAFGHSIPKPETGIITLDTTLHVDLERQYQWLELALVYAPNALDQKQLPPAFFTTKVLIHAEAYHD